MLCDPRRGVSPHRFANVQLRSVPCQGFQRTGEINAVEGVLTSKLDEGVSLAMFVEFAQNMFPGFSTADVGVSPTDEASSWSRSAVAEQLRRIETRPDWHLAFSHAREKEAGRLPRAASRHDGHTAHLGDTLSISIVGQVGSLATIRYFFICFCG